MAAAPFPLADRLRRIHDEVERAALAHAVMTLEDTTSLARDHATDRFVRAMDQIFADLDDLRRSGELAGIETMIRRLA
jgi:hypothetical protein